MTAPIEALRDLEKLQAIDDPELAGYLRTLYEAVVKQEQHLANRKRQLRFQWKESA